MIEKLGAQHSARIQLGHTEGLFTAPRDNFSDGTCARGNLVEILRDRRSPR